MFVWVFMRCLTSFPTQPSTKQEYLEVLLEKPAAKTRWRRIELGKEKKIKFCLHFDLSPAQCYGIFDKRQQRVHEKVRDAEFSFHFCRATIRGQNLWCEQIWSNNMFWRKGDTADKFFWRKDDTVNKRIRRPIFWQCCNQLISLVKEWIL